MHIRCIGIAAPKSPRSYRCVDIAVLISPHTSMPGAHSRLHNNKTSTERKTGRAITPHRYYKKIVYLRLLLQHNCCPRHSIVKETFRYDMIPGTRCQRGAPRSCCTGYSASATKMYHEIKSKKTILPPQIPGLLAAATEGKQAIASYSSHNATTSSSNSRIFLLLTVLRQAQNKKLEHQ